VASAIVELKDVSLLIDDHIVLKSVNLALHKGEVLVLIGPSGTGKTLLLKIMAGLMPPTSGQVLIDGQDLYSCSEKKRAQLMRRMGMLFQKNALFDSLTCIENIAFPLREVGGQSPSEAQDRSVNYLDAVGLNQAAQLFPDEISGGMQKRLGIARALALDPEIVFYDDPTAGLDPITSRKIVDLILGLQRKLASTIVCITNDMNRAYQMADRIAFVEGHAVMVTGNESETKSSTDPRVLQFIRGLVEGPLTPKEVSS